MTTSRISIELYPEGMARLQKLAEKYHLTLAKYGPEPEDEKTNVALFGKDFIVMLVINREEVEWRYYDLSDTSAVQEYLLSYWLFKIHHPQDEVFQSVSNVPPIQMVETLLPVFIDGLEKSASKILTGNRSWVAELKTAQQELHLGNDYSIRGSQLQDILSEAKKHSPK